MAQHSEEPSQLAKSLRTLEQIVSSYRNNSKTALKRPSFGESANIPFGSDVARLDTVEAVEPSFDQFTASKRLDAAKYQHSQLQSSDLRSPPLRRNYPCERSGLARLDTVKAVEPCLDFFTGGSGSIRSRSPPRAYANCSARRSHRDQLSPADCNVRSPHRTSHADCPPSSAYTGERQSPSRDRMFDQRSPRTYHRHSPNRRYGSGPVSPATRDRRSPQRIQDLRSPPSMSDRYSPPSSYIRQSLENQACVPQSARHEYAGFGKPGSISYVDWDAPGRSGRSSCQGSSSMAPARLDFVVAEPPRLDYFADYNYEEPPPIAEAKANEMNSRPRPEVSDESHKLYESTIYFEDKKLLLLSREQGWPYYSIRRGSNNESYEFYEGGWNIRLMRYIQEKYGYELSDMLVLHGVLKRCRVPLNRQVTPDDVDDNLRAHMSDVLIRDLLDHTLISPAPSACDISDRMVTYDEPKDRKDVKFWYEFRQSIPRIQYLDSPPCTPSPGPDVPDFNPDSPNPEGLPTQGLHSGDEDPFLNPITGMSRGQKTVDLNGDDLRGRNLIDLFQSSPACTISMVLNSVAKPRKLLSKDDLMLRGRSYSPD